jgi:uncharacterized protein YndB with AHSA1/START domain
MAFDPAAIGGLVTREVRAGVRDGVATRTVVARRVYPASQADLWDALTNPERIPRWFLPVSGDLRAGGRYQLQGNAGGVVEACREPESFAVTWEFGPTRSWLAVTLTPDGGQTALELAHEAPVDPEMWEQFGPGAVGVGWDLALIGLGLHLDSGGAVDPARATAFPASPEGTAFILASAADWGVAAIAGGDQPDAARGAAARTAAFYTPPAAGAGAGDGDGPAGAGPGDPAGR